MRPSTDLYSSINAAIQSSEASLQKAVNQLSSGKRVSLPSDDALAFSQNIQSLASSASVDRYTKNADAVLSQAQMADSALSTVVTSLTSALSLGTAGGGSNLTSTDRSTLAKQVESILAGVVAQANTKIGGSSLFAGTASVDEAFIPDPNKSGSFVYAGNGNANRAAVGDSLDVSESVAGDEIFQSPSGNVLGSLEQLVTALTSGTASDLATATSSVSSAIAHISEVRAVYGSTVTQLTSQTDFLSKETVSLSSQQQSLMNADIATSATALTQAQVMNSAVLAVAAKVLPESLLNYLH